MIIKQAVLITFWDIACKSFQWGQERNSDVMNAVRRWVSRLGLVSSSLALSLCTPAFMCQN